MRRSIGAAQSATEQQPLSICLHSASQTLSPPTTLQCPQTCTCSMHHIIAQRDEGCVRSDSGKPKYGKSDGFAAQKTHRSPLQTRNCRSNASSHVPLAPMSRIPSLNQLPKIQTLSAPKKNETSICSRQVRRPWKPLQITQNNKNHYCT